MVKHGKPESDFMMSEVPMGHISAVQIGDVVRLLPNISAREIWFDFATALLAGVCVVATHIPLGRLTKAHRGVRIGLCILVPPLIWLIGLNVSLLIFGRAFPDFWTDRVVIGLYFTTTQVVLTSFVVAWFVDSRKKLLIRSLLTIALALMFQGFWTVRFLYLSQFDAHVVTEILHRSDKSPGVN